MTAREIKDSKLLEVLILAETRIGKKREDLLAEYDALIASAPAALSVADKAIYAREKLKAIYKTQMRSPAVMTQGLVLGVGDLIDTVAGSRATAIQIFKAAPEKAKAEGFVDPTSTAASIIPLDRDANYKSSGQPNPNFGKPLPEHSYMKNTITISSYGENPPRVTKMILNNENAQKDIAPFIGKTVSYRANVPQKQKSDIIFTMNQSTKTEFTETPIPSMPDVDTVLKSAILAPFRCNKLVDLLKFHEAHKGDNNFFVVVSGRVSDVTPEPNAKTGNYMMVLDSLLDDDLPPDHPGITVFIPGTHKALMTFDAPTVVTVIGTVAENERDNEKRAIINAMGIFCDSKWFFPKGQNPADATKQAQQVK